MATQNSVASGPGAQQRRSLEATSPRYGEKFIKVLLGFAAAFSVLVTIGIVFSLLFGAIDFFEEVSIGEFLFAGTEWAPSFADANFWVIPIVAGTLNIVFWALVVAVPVGLASAIYMSEYAPRRVRKVIKPMLEILEGIPTVAIGLFGLIFVVPLAKDLLPFLPWSSPFSIGVAGVLVGLLTVPLVASVSDDAMRSVPAGLREGAYALGASKFRVSTRVVFPGAISGIVAAFVLAISRAIGETMVVLLVAGAFAQLSFDPTKSVQTMTAYIGQTATGDIAFGTIDYNTIFAVGALLFVMTFVMNVFAIRLVRRFREVYE